VTFWGPISLIIVSVGLVSCHQTKTDQIYIPPETTQPAGICELIQWELKRENAREMDGVLADAPKINGRKMQDLKSLQWLVQSDI